MLIRVGLAAEQHAAESIGSGANGTLLGDGSAVLGRTARREANRARTVAEMSEVATAVASGRIGAPQVDAIARAAKSLDEEHRHLLNSRTTVDAAASLPADVFARFIRREAKRIKDSTGLGDTTTRQQRSSWKHWFDEQTGMGHIHGEFDPERYEAVVGAVEAEVTRLANAGGVKKNKNLSAQAAFNLMTGVSERSGSGRPHISLVVDWKTFAEGPHDSSITETRSGHSIATESVSRLACDAVLQRIELDTNGIPVNVGRKYRTASDAQWQSVAAIYTSCAWHGCDRPLSWCQLHHIHEWEHGGPTDLCNLVPLCSTHHHAVHEGRWTIKLHDDDRRLDIFSPDKRYVATTAPDRFRPSETSRPRGPTTDRRRQ